MRLPVLPFQVAVLAISLTIAAPGPAGTTSEQRPDEQRPSVLEGDMTLPAGWQLLFHGGCQFTVPVPWRVEGDGALAFSPDGAIAIAIASIPITDWSAHTGQIRTDLRPAAVREDSGRRFWCEFRDEVRLAHYVAVPNGPTACIGQMDVRWPEGRDADATIQRIIRSVAPALIQGR